MSKDRPADIGGTAHLGTKDEAERELYEAFDGHLNKKPLQPGERRVTRFAQWTKTGIGRDLFDKVVGATKAAPPGASGSPPAEAQRAAQIQKGAEILVNETADMVIKDAARHGVALTKEAARTMVRKADPRLAAAEMGEN